MTHQQNKTERFLSACISPTVLEIWGIHPKRTQMSQIWCDPDVPEFAQPPKHGMHLDSKKEIRILPICAHSAHDNWQLFRYMGQCMREADKKKKKKQLRWGRPRCWWWLLWLHSQKSTYKCMALATSHTPVSIHVFIRHADCHSMMEICQPTVCIFFSLIW